ncbi:inovirus Gp2 family protein [Vibrio kanaloae]|uniref:inovirus Gp2 family protein n=1 Tax=Vibrio kanaloae TaxID=170673 RepID=UPI0010BE77C8|nr:inovirus Gp2 family protein [Vibrio kanaloae]TKF74533.1 inovirus Gp2 family protein [Vibrio kanaloae]
MKESTYHGLTIQGSQEENNMLYLDRLLNTMNSALEEYTRVYAIRIDLRLPVDDSFFDCLSRDEIVSYNLRRTNLMKRFTESLSARIEAQARKIRGERKRVHSCNVRYAWVRERDTSCNDHYHLVLFLNKERFCKAGDYSGQDSLAALAIKSWASALGCAAEDVCRLVYFPRNHGYHLDSNHKDFSCWYSKLFYRISYLAKKRTKRYGEGHRCFGCSTR